MPCIWCAPFVWHRSHFCVLWKWYGMVSKENTIFGSLILRQWYKMCLLPYFMPTTQWQINHSEEIYLLGIQMSEEYRIYEVPTLFETFASMLNFQFLLNLSNNLTLTRHHNSTLWIDADIPLHTTVRPYNLQVSMFLASFVHALHCIQDLFLIPEDTNNVHFFSFWP